MSESTADGPTEPKVENDTEKEDNETMDDADVNNPPTDEDLPFLPNVKIVSELNLKNWIIYVSFRTSSNNNIILILITG